MGDLGKPFIHVEVSDVDDLSEVKVEYTPVPNRPHIGVVAGYVSKSYNITVTLMTNDIFSTKKTLKPYTLRPTLTSLNENLIFPYIKTLNYNLVKLMEREFKVFDPTKAVYHVYTAFINPPFYPIVKFESDKIVTSFMDISGGSNLSPDGHCYFLSLGYTQIIHYPFNAKDIPTVQETYNRFSDFYSNVLVPRSIQLIDDFLKTKLEDVKHCVLGLLRVSEGDGVLDVNATLDANRPCRGYILYYEIDPSVNTGKFVVPQTTYLHVPKHIGDWLKSEVSRVGDDIFKLKPLVMLAASMNVNRFNDLFIKHLVSFLGQIPDPPTK